MSTIQDKIATDEQNVAAAQAVLDTANAQLAADENKLANVQPHLDLLTQIETEFSRVEEGVEDALKAGLEDVKSRVLPLIQQMRDLFSAQ